MDKSAKIAIASDHGGYNLKELIFDYLKESGYTVNDFGTKTQESCDYPIYAKKVAQAVVSGEYDKGILVCGTGIGMQIAANKIKGIRAACVSDTFSARMSVEHNNCNILTLGERVIGAGLAKEIVSVWLDSDFLGGRHKKRVDMLDSIDNLNI